MRRLATAARFWFGAGSLPQPPPGNRATQWRGYVGSIGFFHGEAPAEGGESHAVVLDQQLAMVDGNLLLVQTADVAAAEGEEHHAKFVPLFRAPSADLNVTFALAIATMVMVQIHGIRAQGSSYFKKFWNTSGHGFMKGINIFVGIFT